MNDVVTTTDTELLPADASIDLTVKLQELKPDDEGVTPTFRTLTEFSGKTISFIALATGSHCYSFEQAQVDRIELFSHNRTPELPAGSEWQFMVFGFTDGTGAVLHHHRDCCESVDLHDIEGDLSDLLDRPLTVYEKVSGTPAGLDEYDSETWTFYRFATERGMVVLRWIGESNGYYSESVDIETGVITMQGNVLSFDQKRLG